MLKQIRSNFLIVVGILMITSGVAGCGKSPSRTKQLAAKATVAGSPTLLASLEPGLAASEQKASSDGIIFRQMGNTVAVDVSSAANNDLNDGTTLSDLQAILDAHDPSVLANLINTDPNRAAMLSSAITSIQYALQFLNADSGN